MPEKSVSELLDILLARLKCDDTNPYAPVVRTWDSIVGPDLIGHCSLQDIKGSTLIVKVDHPAWAVVVSMRKQKIIEHISKMYPELQIKRLQVRISSNT